MHPKQVFRQDKNGSSWYTRWVCCQPDQCDLKRLEKWVNRNLRNLYKDRKCGESAVSVCFTPFLSYTFFLCLAKSACQFDILMCYPRTIQKGLVLSSKKHTSDYIFLQNLFWLRRQQNYNVFWVFFPFLFASDSVFLPNALLLCFLSSN